MTAAQKNTITKGAVVFVVGGTAYYLFTVFVRQVGGMVSPPAVKAPDPLLNPLSPDTSTKPDGKKTGGNYEYTPNSTYNYLNWAETIYQALQFGHTNSFGEIWNVFQNMRTQGDARGVAVMFAGKYDMDMWTYLQNGMGIWIIGTGLSDAHLQQLHDYVAALPGGAGATTKKKKVKGLNMVNCAY